MTDNVAINIKCLKCSNNFQFLATKEQFENLIAGKKFIQDIFPDMPAADRELFISRICGECFKKIFSEEEY